MLGLLWDDFWQTGMITGLPGTFTNISGMMISNSELIDRCMKINCRFFGMITSLGGKICG